MKKTLIFLLALSGAAMADYVWKGGEDITTDKWADQANWELTNGSEWKTGGSGPGTTNSNMWNPIRISNASGTIGANNKTEGKIEGWTLDLTLESTDLTITWITKFQGGCTLDIDQKSSLTISEYWGGNDGEAITLNNRGSFTLGYSTRQQGGNGFNMNLYDTGVVHFTAQNTASANSAKVASVAAQLTGATDSVLTRTLITIDQQGDHSVAFDNTATTYNFTDANGNSLTAVDSLDALNAATTSSYFVTKDGTGLSVSYKLIPEPTTATLSLLALAGLAARRRRR